MIDVSPIISRWRERCALALSSRLGITEQGIAKAINVSDGLSVDELMNKLKVMLDDAVREGRSSLKGLRVAREWLIEEIDNGSL